MQSTHRRLQRKINQDCLFERCVPNLPFDQSYSMFSTTAFYLRYGPGVDDHQLLPCPFSSVDVRFDVRPGIENDSIANSKAGDVIPQSLNRPCAARPKQSWVTLRARALIPSEQHLGVKRLDSNGMIPD